MIEHFPEQELRSYCRARLEALELWLRRLIHQTLADAYGEHYFDHADQHGNRLIKTAIVRDVDQRMRRSAGRYPRRVDALQLDEAIDILCKPGLYDRHFRHALQTAFPEGHEEARTFLYRLLEPRNHLAHANGISIHQAKRVICYTEDVIDSLKRSYRDQGMQEEYDAPLILRFSDSFGNEMHREQMRPVHDGGIGAFFHEDPETFLRPGEILKLEIEVDPNYDRGSYTIQWACMKGLAGIEDTAPQLVIPIDWHHVGRQLSIHCHVTANRAWHRMQSGADDFLAVSYRVQPPIGG